MYGNKKTKIIIVMLIIVVFMAVGYAILSTNLNIQGTSNLTDSWGIRISSVESTSTGRAYNISDPTYSNTTMTFNVGVKEPGDKMTFTVTVQNYGTLDAILDNIDASSSGSYVIKYGIDGIQEGTRLLAGESITFTITTEFDINAESLPLEPIKELTVTLNYIQDDGQVITPSDPNIDNNDTGQPTLINAILRDNQAQSDANIDFGKTSEEDGTKGLYYTSENTEDNKTTYYFRGAVENNYVEFAGFYWRIIRINEDGSIRLMYQTKTDDIIENISSVGSSKFNENFDDNTYVGYMYGTPDSQTYSETHANVNSSAIKSVVDAWYEENLLSYALYIADSGFCGDRSVASEDGLWNSSDAYYDTALGYKNNITHYGAYNRLVNNKTPQFGCPQENDLYTTSNSNKGNKALLYPIGLITTDELAYAGAVYQKYNTSYYLYGLIPYWTMSPLRFNGTGIVVWEVFNQGSMIDGNYANVKVSIRPVINLKANIEIVSGNGTSGNPYVIKTN